MTLSPAHVAAVVSLSDSCQSSYEFYRDAAEGVENLALKDLLEEYAAQREKFAEEMKALAQSLSGGSPIHACEATLLTPDLVDLKPATDEEDEQTLLSQCEHVEGEVLSCYRETLQHSLPADIHQTILGQFESLLASQARLEALKEAAADMVVAID